MPRSDSARWFAALAALVVFVLLAWLLGAVLTLTDGERVALRVGLVALGLIAAAALLWYLRPQDRSAATAPRRPRDEALAAVATARARMPRGAFDARPLALVLGSEGSCKTTVVTHAGIDVELLAGDAVAGDGPPAPTAAANLWLAREGVLAEAGGPVFADADRWKAFVRALRAPRLRAAVGLRAAPARSAVVCVSCDLFYAGDGGARLDALAALTRERLAGAARGLGQTLPVYVLFTKADRVPDFEAWAAPLGRDEIRVPLGAAVPLSPAAGAAGGTAAARAAGGHAERLAPLVTQGLDAIVARLAAHRLDLLARETVLGQRLAAYELPRELGKLAPAVTRFLVELCRPLQLGVSPELRGFYFVGARPLVVSDVAAPPSPGAASAAPVSGNRATVAFAQASLGVVAPATPAAYGPPTTRRVPQWTFLERLFPDVVFADPVPAALAGGGTRVAFLRRAALGAGIAAALVLSLGVLGSWLGNRRLADRTLGAAQAVAALPVVTAQPGTVALPSAEALRRLDALRGVLDTVRDYETAGVPLRLQWGLWRGNALLADGRRVWLDGYRRHLHDAAWGAILDSLRALPDAPRPTDDYGRAYAWLRAYLEMTSAPEHATPEFLAPVLLAAWQRGSPTDADVTALARRQFEFYAGELPRANPWPRAADADLVRHTRAFLGGFQGSERIYQYMLAEASKATKPARLVDVSPPSVGVVSAPDVAGPFTAAGWRYMQDAFRNVDRFFQGERWVVGDATAAQAQDRDRTVAELRVRYRDDYVQQWRTYLRSVAVVGPSSTADAARRLGVIGGPQSPLLAALSLAARNTAVDSGITRAFQPVSVVSPGAPDKLVTDAGQPYVNALLALEGQLEQVATMPPVTDTASAQQVAQAGQQALAKSTDAKTAARQLAAKFSADSSAAQVGPAVAALLVAPIDAAEAVLRGVAATRPPPPRKVAGGGGGGGGGAGAPAAPAAAPAAPAAAPAPAPAPNVAALARTLNERGAALCQQMAPMLAKFPFAPDATADATLAEIAAALAPGSGALWTFQQDLLGGVLEKQGARWVPAPNAPVALSQQFVEFFNRAAQASAGLFPAGATEPHVVVEAHATPTGQAPLVVLVQGTKEARFDKNSPPQQFVWPSATGRNAALYVESGQLLGVIRGAKRKYLARGAGDWALFRVVAQAAKSEGAHAEWVDKDAGTVAVDFTFENGGVPVLARGWLGRMTCAPQVTK